MVHFIFLLKLAISRNITKLVSQFLDLRNRRYDFSKKAKNQDLNKRKEKTVESLTVGTRTSVTPRTEDTFGGKCSPTVSFSGGSKGTSVLLE